MRVPRSVVVLRLCCLLALLASAALTADTLNPGRKFCPLDAACAKARDSALGSFYGVKTSILGIGAFAGLFLLTLLPLHVARKVVRPSAWLAGAAGLAFVVYQALVLGTFCPLCLVADLCGLGAAAAATAWPAPLLYRGRAKKRPPAAESVPARLRWAFAAQLVVGVPLLWPTAPAKPSWVELPVDTRTMASIDVEAEFAPFLAERSPEGADGAAADAGSSDDVPSPGRDPWAIELPSPKPTPMPEGVAAEVAPAPRPAPRPAPAPVKAQLPTAVIAPPKPAAREIVVLEYLNAFCSHCRATHARLDRVVASFGRPVRRHRVYVWSSNQVPLWARACAVAAQQGREDAMFDALLETERQDDRTIRAAAARAGVDLSAIDAPEVSLRLDRDRRLASQARLEGLPTFDVGRRRLMGEQSEGELLDALRAAAGG